MRLRTFESFWLLTNGIMHSYPSLHQGVECCEIAVVGGGITGALMSHALVESGWDVILVDKRDIASGSTAATTSMLQYEVDVPLCRLAEMIGEGPAARCYQAGVESVLQLGKLVREKQLDCGFEMKRSLYIAREKSHAGWLRGECAIRARHGLDVEWLEPRQVAREYGIACYGAILSHTAASVDAYRMAHELIALNAKRGMRVFDQCDIKSFDFNDNGLHIQMTGDAGISCKQVVFCTGYEATRMLKEKVAGLFYTYACVSEQGIGVPATLAQTLVWDTGSPYFYMRTTPDGRLLIGGEDSATNVPLFQNRIKDRKGKKLQAHLGNIMPGIGFIEDFSWGGTFGSTKDGLPYIGASPEYKNAFFVLGFGGNGIIFSAQAMDIIPRLMGGKTSELAHCYRFGR